MVCEMKNLNEFDISALIQLPSGLQACNVLDFSL